MGRMFVSAELSNGMQTGVKLQVRNYMRVVDFNVVPLCTTFYRCPLNDMRKETDRYRAENS
jgi:hypothetical protein